MKHEDANATTAVAKKGYVRRVLNGEWHVTKPLHPQVSNRVSSP